MKTYPTILLLTLPFIMAACYKWDNPYDKDGDNPGTLPEITTTGVSNVTATTATSGGNITSDGGLPITARGVCWGTGSAPTTANSKTTNGTGTGSFTSTLTGLNLNITYYVRAYATNSVGTVYGNNVSFTMGLPILTTKTVTGITNNSATSGGTITSDGGLPITVRGVCWATTQNPTTANSKTIDGSGTGSWVSELTGLTLNTTYYVRAYATNSVGTSYGNEQTFKTLTAITDYDGNTYTTVTIGTQVWMVENLKTTKYNDGTAIPNITDAGTWAGLTTPGYCWYDNNSANKAAYGALYNFYAVNTGKLAPTGWHVPSDEEWKTLEMYLGMTQTEADATGWRGTDQGTQLKSTTGWNSGGNGTNSSGFTALPGGYRYDDGTFGSIGDGGYWWSSSAFDTSVAWGRGLGSSSSIVYRGYYSSHYGYSVRCVRDN